MMRPPSAAYTKTVHRYPGTAAALALIVFAVACTGTALAAPVLIDAGSAPVVVVQLKTGMLTIRTWGRNQVQIDTQGTVDWLHVTPQEVASNLPATQTVLAQTAQSPKGPVTLPPESFVTPALAPGPHEGVRVNGDGATTITVPQGTALILARVGGGSIDLQGYHQGAFFAVVHTGRILLNDVSGTGFAQVTKGQIFASDSTFARIRARTGLGNIGFENCASQQIEVTSIRGSIAYDNGSFQPGLARFESQDGNIALGVASGGAQVSAHAASGRLFTEFAGRSNVTVTGADASGAIGGGGPTVTASTARGAVLLYDGALRDHPNVAANVPGMRAFVIRTTNMRTFVPATAPRAPTQGVIRGAGRPLQSKPLAGRKDKHPPH